MGKAVLSVEFEDLHACPIRLNIDKGLLKPMIRKRGAAVPAPPAATLVLMIVLFFVLYLVLIPSSDREKILQANQPSETQLSTPDGSSVSERGPTAYRTLLVESPGVVYPYLRDVLAVPLPADNLFSTQERENQFL